MDKTLECPERLALLPQEDEQYEDLRVADETRTYHVVCRVPLDDAPVPDYNDLQWRSARQIVKRWNSHEPLLTALKELHALVKGESPSLLNEDSGGDARLALKIEALIENEGVK